MAAREVLRAEVLGKERRLRERAEELAHLSIRLPLTDEELAELETLRSARIALSEAAELVTRVVPERLACWDDVRDLIEAVDAACRELRRRLGDSDDVAANVEAVGDLIDAVDAVLRNLVLLLTRLA